MAWVLLEILGIIKHISVQIVFFPKERNVLEPAFWTTMYNQKYSFILMLAYKLNRNISFLG